MLTSKQRAELRSQANTLDTTLMVGKGGVTQSLLDEANTQLAARELVKGRVLESALLTAREACDAICEGTGADGVQCVGSKFVIYKKNEKKAKIAAEKQRNDARAKENPVRKGAQARRQAAQQVRQQRNAYFRQQAIDRAIEKAREKKLRGED